MIHFTSEDIVRWHTETFPDCHVDSQVAKFGEELKEFLDNRDPMELADLYIVNTIIIGRYKRIITDGLYNWCRDKVDLTDEHILFLVDQKMEVNSKRRWKKINGVYKHI